MVKLVCVNCGKTWYTANTSSNQKCDDCGGILKESEKYEAEKLIKTNNYKL